MIHLDEAAQEALGLPIEKRIEYILEPRWLGYDAADRVLNKLERLLIHPKIHRMPNLLIVGETNNGKTALVGRFLGLHTASHSDDVMTIPVVYTQAPPEPNERRFLAELLDQLGVPRKHNERVEGLMFQIRTVLPVLGVRMIIIDEIHHLLAGSSVRQRTFLQVIKYLGNDLRLPIVAVGTKEAFNALQSDPQLANRFTPAELPRWTNKTAFRRLLATFERLLPLRHPSNLQAPEMALRISLMSEGSIGETSLLLNEAAVEAIRGGEERITDHVLNRLGWLPPSERRKYAISVI